MNDLAAAHPDKVQETIDLWFHAAGRFNGLPLIDRTTVEVLADPNRPQVAPPRDRYVYYPGTAEVPETAAVNVRNRSYSIIVEVGIDTGGTGVLFSQGRVSGATRSTSRMGSSSTCTTSSVQRADGRVAPRQSPPAT